MVTPQYYEVKMNEEVPSEKKMDCNKSILITVRDDISHTYERYVFEIFDVRTIESGGLATIVLPFIFPRVRNGEIYFALTLTDDPYCDDAAGMGSLGYSFIKLLMIKATMYASGDRTFIQCPLVCFRRAITLPER